MPLIKEYVTQYRVYSEDTDFMGIVYHANYLNFFERARTDFLRENGLPLTQLATYDCHFAIYDVQLRYLHPARLEDCVIIRTQISKMGSCSVLFSQSMQNQNEVVLCEGKINVVCVTSSMKPKRLPAFFK